MDATEFRQSNGIVAKFIVEYMDNLPKQNLLPNVEPGYIKERLEQECPDQGIHFTNIFNDFQKDVQNGLIPWSSPHFHSQFAFGNSYESMVAELLIASLNLGCINWEASPAPTELEMTVTNWLAKMMNLPNEFLHSSGSFGGGAFQNTTTEATLLSLLAARTRTIEHYSSGNLPINNLNPQSNGVENLDKNTSKIVVYASTHAHSSTKRAVLITNLHYHELNPNSSGQITAETLRSAFDSDQAKGLIPCIFVTTLGTDLGSFDDLAEVGPVCKAFSVWLHADASYFGSILLGSEFHSISNRMFNDTDSITVAIDTTLPVSQDTVAYWTKDKRPMEETLNVNPVYLRHKDTGIIHDYLNWQLGTGRKFKTLKVWVVLKSFGSKGIQKLVSSRIKLAQYMKNKILEDIRFELTGSLPEVVNFRLRDEYSKSDADETAKLLRKINDGGKASLGAFEHDGKFYIRFIVNHNMSVEDMDFAWNEIETYLTEV